MHKKILRILSLALAILLLVSVIPPETSANELEISEIRKQITSTYKAAKRWSGRPSFSGYCASLVNWQLYLMGITEEKLSNNGNQEYDYFAKRDYTSGGYRVHSYPANRYSMEDALNLVSQNGTKNAYNMIVCFQSTNSAAGRRYGHAFLVHAIIDGVVYFSESSSMSINGKYYPEGSAVAVPIKEFCQYYARWAVYEGLIYFGRKTYADECDYFSSNLYASITETAPVYSSPCTTETDGRSHFRYNIAAGERVHAVGLYLNTEGEYWYELDDGHSGYIPADKTSLISLDYSDIIATDIVAPNNLRSGVAFNLKGHVMSDHSRIYTLRAQIYAVKDGVCTEMHSVTAMVDGLDYNLKGSTLSNKLPFRKLPKGTYQYRLAAVVGNYYFADGTMQLEWKTVSLWNSQFQVVSSRGKTKTVYFDSLGGTAELNQLEVSTGAAIGTLPVAQREGYIFDGWYTQEVGGEMVTEDMPVEANTVVYARWIADPTVVGWYPVNGIWYYLSEGLPYSGFVETDGITYYTDENGVPVTGWKEVDGSIYYFSSTGIMQTGDILVNGKRHLLGADGAALHGWTELDGNTCYLNTDGSLCTGWITVDGDDHYFDSFTGKLVMSHLEGSDPFDYVIYDDVKAAELLEPILNTMGIKPLPIH